MTLPNAAKLFLKNHGIFSKRKDLTDPSLKPPKKPKPKNNNNKDNLETYLHLIRKIVDEAPNKT